MPTKIDYLDETWNPIAGCTKCSPGCDNCYAERMAHRLKSMGNNNPQYLGKTDAYGKWTGEVECCEWLLDKPLHWRKPRTIGVCFMSDLFHPKVPDSFIGDVFDVIRRTPQHTHLILTKRVGRMKDVAVALTVAHGAKYFKHVQWGVSVSNQAEADEKIPLLLQIPAEKRFVSLEPLLGEIDFVNGIKEPDGSDWWNGFLMDTMDGIASYLHWVVVGCESGPKRRPCDPDWIRSIIRQCKAVGVKCFVKQINLNGKVSHNPAEWPEDLRCRQSL